MENKNAQKIKAEYRKHFMDALINDFKKYASEAIESGYLDDIDDHVVAFEILADNFAEKLNDAEI